MKSENTAKGGLKRRDYSTTWIQCIHSKNKILIDPSLEVCAKSISINFTHIWKYRITHAHVEMSIENSLEMMSFTLVVNQVFGKAQTSANRQVNK